MQYPKPYSSQQPQTGPVAPPMVYVHEDTVWEYKRIVRNLAQSEPPTAAELNGFGKEGWELTTIVTHGEMLYCYLKRMA